MSFKQALHRVSLIFGKQLSEPEVYVGEMFRPTGTTLNLLEVAFPVRNEEDVWLGAVPMLVELFRYFLRRPDQLGEQARKRIGTDGLHRAVCDYLAGMTDRYAMTEHNRLFGLRV